MGRPGSSLVAHRNPAPSSCSKKSRKLIASERMADPQELADVAILVLDMFNLEGIDMAEAVRIQNAHQRRPSLDRRR